MHKIFTFFNRMAKNMDTVKKYEKKIDNSSRVFYHDFHNRKVL